MQQLYSSCQAVFSSLFCQDGLSLLTAFLHVDSSSCVYSVDIACIPLLKLALVFQPRLSVKQESGQSLSANYDNAGG